MGTKINLFDMGNLDVSDSLPNITTEDSVEVNYEVASAEVEGKLIEQTVEQQMTGLEDAQDVLEEMKEVIVQHEANVQSMNGEEVGGEAKDSSGEVVAEVPAETQPQVDQNSSNEEVAEQNQEMQQGVESACGRLFGKTADEVFAALRINNPYITAGLNSISGNSVRVAYTEGLEGVKDLAGKVWFKIKAMIQSIIQWISKWIHKAVIWIKGYESKAKKLKEEAQKLDDNAKAKEDFEFSQFAALLVKEPGLLDIKGIYNDVKAIAGDGGICVKAVHETVNRAKAKAGQSGGDNTATKDDKTTGAGNNSVSFYNRGLLNDQTQQQQSNSQNGDNKGEGNSEGGEIWKKAIEGFNATKISLLAKHSKVKEAMSGNFIGWKMVLGPNNMKSFHVLDNNMGTAKFETIEYFENAPKASEINPSVTGKWAKDEIVKICDAITSNISEFKGTLDKGNSAFNKIRNEVFNNNAKESFSSEIGSTVIGYSKVAQKALVAAAYLPGYYLNACGEYLKALKGESSSKDDGSNKDGGSSNQPTQDK